MASKKSARNVGVVPERGVVLSAMVALIVLSLLAQLQYANFAVERSTSVLYQKQLLRQLGVMHSLELVNTTNASALLRMTEEEERAQQRIYDSRAMAAARREDPSACVELSPNHLVGEFAQPDKCWTRRQVQAILISIVHEFSTLLERYNVRYWVDSGTLLGAVRHNGLIPFDQDVDFGIEQAGYELLRDTRVDVPDGFALHVYESAVNDVGRVDNAIPIRFVHRASGLYADVFAFLDKVDAEGRHSIGPIPSLCFGGCAHCPSTGSGRREFRIPREWVFPLRQCRFEYFLVACPNDSHRYLTHMFGDYSTPYAD